jgi:uncharacterized membrane protein (UPF0127 family)
LLEEGLERLQSAQGSSGAVKRLRVRNATKGTVVADRANIADTSQKRRTGLLQHSGLAEGEGLWIVPCEGIHMFGMKFAIDVLFLDKKRKVLKVSAGMLASGIRRRMSASLMAHSVLELPVGMAGKTGTEVGDQLELEKYDA